METSRALRRLFEALRVRALMRGPRRDGFRRRFSALALMRHLIAFDLFNVA